MDDHSFVAGLGYHPGLEEEVNPLDLAGPQATSTVAAKMTRYGKEGKASQEETSTTH